MDENLTKREVMLFAREMKNGKMTPTLALFIPDVYDKGTVVTDVFDPNFTKIDNWANTTNQIIESIKTALEKKVENTVQVIGEEILTGGGALNSEKIIIKHKTGSGYNHIPTGGGTGQYLKWLKNGEAQWADIDINLDDYYNKGEVDNKFKNFCPIPVGGVLPMWNETNPTSLYLGTTWELISAGKYVQTGDTALQVGGSNSLKIEKTNLPAIKLNTTSSTATLANHYHLEFYSDGKEHKGVGTPTNSSYVYSYGNASSDAYERSNLGKSTYAPNIGKTSDSGGGTTGSFSLQTETLGSGTSLTIQPSYITLKFWKRLS